MSVAGPFGAGARVAAPLPRFHFPLVEPNVRYLRIRLSDRHSCFRPREVAGQRRQVDQPECLVQVLLREACLPIAADLVFLAQPPAKPQRGVCVDCPVRLTNRAEAKIICPPEQLPIQSCDHDIGIKTQRPSLGLRTDRRDHALDTLL